MGCSATTKCATWAAPDSAPRPIGRITLGAKRAGKRPTGNPLAPSEVAGAGDGLTATLHGHEAGNGGHSQGEPTGTAPVLDPTFREGDGNVGIIRSPVRAIALPDLLVGPWDHVAEGAYYQFVAV